METIFKNIDKMAKPYIFLIANYAAIEQTARLFGYARFISKPNFGSDNGIKITCNGGNIEYEEVLRTSAIKNFGYLVSVFDFGKERFKELSKNLELHMNYTDINGKAFCDPIPLSVYVEKGVEYENKLPIEYPSKIDCNCFIEIVMPPKTSFLYYIYPNEINDGWKIKKYKNPNIEELL